MFHFNNVMSRHRALGQFAHFCFTSALTPVIQFCQNQTHIESAELTINYRVRPYVFENISSRPITEVKQRRARLVLGWVTAWEYRVSYTFDLFCISLKH